MSKNKPVMPRTAGMRSFSEMNQKLTAAGYDTGRLEAHALVAKASNVAARKRKHDEQEAAMEVDEDGEDWSDDAEGMDVDDDANNSSRTVAKRAKANNGVALKNPKVPQTNRQMAGFRDVEVSLIHHCFLSIPKSIFITPASEQGHQDAESRPARTESARQGRRVRSCDQNKDGQSLALVHLIFPINAA